VAPPGLRIELPSSTSHTAVQNVVVMITSKASFVVVALENSVTFAATCSMRNRVSSPSITAVSHREASRQKQVEVRNAVTSEEFEDKNSCRIIIKQTEMGYGVRNAKHFCIGSRTMADKRGPRTHGEARFPFSI
jgi:hypothetical protein